MVNGALYKIGEEEKESAAAAKLVAEQMLFGHSYGFRKTGKIVRRYELQTFPDFPVLLQFPCRSAVLFMDGILQKQGWEHLFYKKKKAAYAPFLAESEGFEPSVGY